MAILGIFVADLAFRAGRACRRSARPSSARGFAMGPGGKGSNQSVAAARVGAKVTFISKIGTRCLRRHRARDLEGGGHRGACGTIGRSRPARPSSMSMTTTGENAIIVVSRRGTSISVADVDAAADAIRGAKVFVTQLEQPQAAAAQRGLEIARARGRRSRCSIRRRPSRFRMRSSVLRLHRCRTRPRPRR